MLADKTGSPDATTGILMIGGAFGNVPQLLQVSQNLGYTRFRTAALNLPTNWIQGADILARGSDSSHQYQVFVPDLLQGQHANPSWFPMDTEAKKQAVAAYFAGDGNPGKSKEKIPGILKEIDEETKGVITIWAAVGLCWGGKVWMTKKTHPSWLQNKILKLHDQVVTLAAFTDSPFAAAVSTHPAMLDPKDGPQITIPYCLLPSMHEDKDAVKAFADAIEVEKYVETFDTMPHVNHFLTPTSG